VSTRAPTLDEWFLAYQLRSMNRDFFFNPAALDVDISAVAERWRVRGQKLSYPALVAKALALTAKQVPAINRAYLSTPLGDRVIEFEHISVNLPVALRENGRSYLSALVVKNADQLSVATIAEQIKQAQARPMDETKITKLVARKPNRLWWRALLRGMHFAAYRWPGIERMGGGGLSVNSVADVREAPVGRVISFGPTALTVLITGVKRDGDGREELQLGVGINHVAIAGMEALHATKVLRDILGTHDPALLAELD
jgi:hypothetical protein